MKLYLFYTNIDILRDALKGGLAGVIVDFERRGKEARQEGFDTQINSHTFEDIAHVKDSTSAYVICRINGVGTHTQEEVKETLNAGADEILIPMVRSTEEVITVMKYTNGHCKVSAMVETVEGMDIVEDICHMGIARIFVGLNDLWIERGTKHLFEAVCDGTVESLRKRVKEVPFGFAGLTLPGKGVPLPCRHLINEMTRLSTDFTFLRRAFLSDTKGLDTTEAIVHILDAVDKASSRSVEEMSADRLELVQAVKALPQGPWR